MVNLLLGVIGVSLLLHLYLWLTIRHLEERVDLHKAMFDNLWGYVLRNEFRGK